MGGIQVPEHQGDFRCSLVTLDPFILSNLVTSQDKISEYVIFIQVFISGGKTNKQTNKQTPKQYH